MTAPEVDGTSPATVLYATVGTIASSIRYPQITSSNAWPGLKTVDHAELLVDASIVCPFEHTSMQCTTKHLKNTTMPGVICRPRDVM